MYNNFFYNPLFFPIKNEIDKRFNKFFNKWIKLCSDVSKQTINENKTEIRDIFYNLAFENIHKDSSLMKALNMIANAEKKMEGNLSPNDLPKEYQEVIIKAAMESFTPIVNELFEIPTLVLTAFKSKTDDFEKELEAYKRKLSDSKKLKPEEPAYKMYIGFVDEILTKDITKYKVIKNYLGSNKNINQTEKSLSNAFDSFLRNHSDEIMKISNIDLVTFTSKFFPAKLSQK